MYIYIYIIHICLSYLLYHHYITCYYIALTLHDSYLICISNSNSNSNSNSVSNGNSKCR